jgi:hypothetical protein
VFKSADEILGSATESDEVLQDSYLRWADGRKAVRMCAVPRAAKFGNTNNFEKGQG